MMLHGAFRWLAVIRLLMIRETRIRYARGRVGYAWAFLLPLAWIGGLIAFFGWLGHRPMAGVPVAWFVASGMLPYVIFRQTISGMTRGLSAGRGLIGFSGIRLADVLFALALLELLNAIVLSALALCLLAVFVGQVTLADTAGSALALVLAWGLGAGFGRFAAMAALVSDFAARILPIALRPMFWISGIFFAAADLPGSLLALLSWNPLLHVTELARRAAFGRDDHGFIDLTVPVLAMAICLAGAHALEHRAETGRPARIVP
jgi:capsular polysaccharide transport system permease protein